MWVHWKKKVMRFTHKGRRISLHGVQDNVKSCKPVQLSKLQGLQKRGAITHMVQVCVKPDGTTFQVEVVEDSNKEALDPAIQQLLDEFSSVFSKPVDLPPSRLADHKIPLVHGAQPVKARP